MITKFCAYFLGCLLLLSPTLYAQPGSPTLYDPPLLQVPAGEEPPGPWPTTVSGANLNASLPPGTVLNGTGQDNLQVELHGYGPLKWSESRHNEGDIAPLVGMQDTGAASDPPAGFVNNYQIGTGPTTHGWRVNQFSGAALATVRVNGRDNENTLGDGGPPVGTFYSTATFNQGFGQGWSYSMVDGTYTNGGNGAMDLTMGIVGQPNGETVVDTGLAFFPYAQHWVGGIINGDSNGDINGVWKTDNDRVAYNKNRMTDTPPVTWANTDEALARVEFPNGPSPQTGMLFVSSVDDDNDPDVASASPRDNGWDVAVRGNSTWIAEGATFNARGNSDASFQFLFVPWTAQNLVGGEINGADGGAIQSAGTFEVSRSGTGEYSLTLPGKTDSDGMLILGNAGTLAGETDIPDNGFLSYQYDTETSSFVIQSRVFNGETDFASFAWPLHDTNFYFAWVDFQNPLDPQVGDVTGDGLINTADIDALRTAIKDGTNTPNFNLYLDGVVSQDDLTFLLQNVLRTTLGDLNLDGSVDAADAGLMFGAWGPNFNGSYANGDFNQDGITDAADAGIMFANWTGDAAPNAVPEPSLGLLLLTVPFLALHRRRAAGSR